VCSGCQAEFNLRDNAAGKRLKCPTCETVIVVPPIELTPIATADADEPLPDIDPAFHRDKFLLRQKHLAISEKYYVWDERGQTIMFIERPAHLLRNLAALFLALLAFVVVTVPVIGGSLTVFGPNGVAVAIAITLGILLAFIAAAATFLALVPKRHITFYSDDTKSHRLLEVLQDQKVALINATYTVNSPEGECLARLRKNYLFNFFRKRWYGYRPDGSELLVAMEDSLILSILRRFLGSFYGLLRTNFIVLKPDQETLLGEFNRKFTLLDRYVLDLSHDRSHYLDRRIAIAVGVMLDTGERR
jgi:uncharacterized protein YxjI